MVQAQGPCVAAAEGAWHRGVAGAREGRVQAGACCSSCHVPLRCAMSGARGLERNDTLMRTVRSATHTPCCTHFHLQGLYTVLDALSLGLVEQSAQELALVQRAADSQDELQGPLQVRAQACCLNRTVARALALDAWPMLSCMWSMGSPLCSMQVFVTLHPVWLPDSPINHVQPL